MYNLKKYFNFLKFDWFLAQLKIYPLLSKKMEAEQHKIGSRIKPAKPCMETSHIKTQASRGRQNWNQIWAQNWNQIWAQKWKQNIGTKIESYLLFLLKPVSIFAPLFLKKWINF